MDGQASRSPELGEVLNRAVARGQAELRVSLPCTVLSYDASNQVVSVQPQIADAYLDADGVLQFEVIQPISGVPVHFPSGGSMRLTFPIQAGDTGMIVVCDRSIDAWKSYGGKQQPTDARRHHFSDAWFECGVNPNGKWKNADASVITIGDDGQPGDFAATANRVQQQLQDLASAISAWTPVPDDGGAALKVALTALFTGPPAWPGSPASSTLKVLG